MPALSANVALELTAARVNLIAPENSDLPSAFDGRDAQPRRGRFVHDRGPTDREREAQALIWGVVTDAMGWQLLAA